MARTLCFKRISTCDVVMMIIGGCLIVTGIVLAICKQPNTYIHHAFQDEVVARPNSTVLDAWIDPPVPVYMKFYVFNVTNGDEYVSGEKPILVEHGPYTYSMFSPRFDIKFYVNDTVSFRNNHILHFQPHLSNGSEDDILYHINIPLVTVSQKMDDHLPFSWILDNLNLMERLLTVTGEKDLIVPHTAKEIIFGYTDPMFETASTIFKSVGRNFDPVFGPFHNFNNSDDGLYLIRTGRKNFSQANEIEKWNGEKYLHYWSTKYANMINGTDGSFLTPNVKREEVRYFYFSQMCRSLKLTYENDSSVYKVKTLRFHFSGDLLENVTANPDNIGFCVPKSNCYGSGVLNAASCGHDAPIFFSLPHFYLAAEEYRRDLIGMKPNKTLHDSVFDVEPVTGAVLRGKRQLQMNVYVRRSRRLTKLKNVIPMIFPYFWLGGVSVIDKPTAKLMYFGITVMEFSNYLPYVIIILGCLAFTKLCCKCDRQDKGQPLIDEDEAAHG